MKRASIEPFRSNINKNPWLAVNLSMLLSGLGLCYANRIREGIGFMAAQLSLITIGAWAIFGDSGNTLLGLFCILPTLFLYVANLFETYRSLSGTSILQAQPHLTRQKDPWFAIFLSQLLPGLGHLYLEDLPFSFLMMVLTLISIGIASVNPWFLLLPPTLYAIGCYQVSHFFPRQFRFLKTWLITMVLVIAVLRLTIGTFPVWVRFFVEPFIVPSTSMLPTLQVGDRILVDKYNHPSLQQGDLIVFRAPLAAANGKKQKVYFYVKRVIGKPGETLEIKDQQVYVNGSPVQENYIAEPPNYQWGPEVIPPNSYFVMGDNRNDSFDSHVWGFLPEQNIVGRAYKIYWPPSRVQPL